MQLTTQGDSRNPSFWRLFANGALVASGTGDFARQCFQEGPRVFLDTLSDAVLGAADPLSQAQFEFLSIACRIAAIERS